MSEEIVPARIGRGDWRSYLDDDATKARRGRRGKPVPLERAVVINARSRLSHHLLQAFAKLRKPVAEHVRAVLDKHEKVAKGSDDQPRDEDGRWTSGGGGTLEHGAWKDLPAETGYVYHATSEENARDIAEGSLQTHGPSHGTDQSSWPDGATERRSYFTDKPTTAYNFAPEDGKPVLLRVTRDAAGVKSERGTGDLYSKTKVPASKLEIALSDGSWAPLKDWAGAHKLAKAKGKPAKPDDPGQPNPHETGAEDVDLTIADTAVRGLDLSELEVVVGDYAMLAAEVYGDTALLAIGGFGLRDNVGIVNQIDTRAAEWARARSAELVGMRYDSNGNLVPSANAEMAIDDSTRRMVRDIIADGLEEGKRSSEIADGLEGLGAYPFSEERAALIANTEIANAHSQGALEGYRQARANGVRVQKEWLVDDDPCEDCAGNADDGPIDLDDTFSSGDDAPSAHPHCNCVLVPYIEGEDEGDEGDDEGM